MKLNFLFSKIHVDDPTSWPKRLSEKHMCRLVRGYLKANGWKLLPTFPGANIQIRAQKNNIWLNSTLSFDRLLGWDTLVRDLHERNSYGPALIGVISAEPVPASVQNEAVGCGTYVIGVRDLPELESIIDKVTTRPVRGVAAAAPAEELLREVPENGSQNIPNL